MNRALIVALLLVFSLGAAAQFSNKQPVAAVKMPAGTLVRYTYDPQHTRLRDADSVEVALIISFPTGFSSSDLKAVKKGKLWETEFVLPDTACALALRFRSDDITDDNAGNGYLYPVYKNGMPVRGAGASMAAIMLRCRRILSLGSSYAANALALYEKDLKQDPSLMEGRELDYYSAMVYTRKKEVFPVLEKRTDSLLRAGFSEKNWTLAAGLMQLTGKRAEADSLKDLIAERTKGKNRTGAGFWQKFLALEADSMLAVMQQQMSIQPPVEERELAYIAGFTLSELAKQGKADKAWEYIHLLKNNDLKAGVFHQIAKAFIDQERRLSDADSLLKMAVKKPAFVPEKGSFLPPSDLENMYIQNQAEYFSTYASLKMLQGDTEAAITFQRSAVLAAGRRNSGFNEKLISYLRQAGQNKELVQEAAAFIAAGAGSPAMIGQLKEVYAGRGSFPAFLDSLETVANKKMQRQLEFDMIKRKLPAFELKTIDGIAVSPETLKGKIVVLDFWATWCLPCKRSFPAMKMAQERYRKDTNVVFLFVNTWESLQPEKRVSQIQGFLTKNKYDFRVLMDAPLGTGSRSYQLAAALGVEGIPTKFIVDRNGDIRFMSIGFTGDDHRMVAELTNMIGIAMKE